MCLSSELVCSNKPEERILSFLHSSIPPSVFAVCVQGSSLRVQSPPLRDLSVSTGFHQVHGGCPSAPSARGHPHTQLSWRLADFSSLKSHLALPIGVSSRLPSTPLEWLKLWLKLMRAIHILGELNCADALSWQPLHPGEWRFHPESVQLIWAHFREA